MGQILEERVPTKEQPQFVVKEMPEPPRSAWSVIGPGIVAASVGLGTGEFILFPYIATRVGLGFLWAAVLAVLTKWFINMEIERYTLATGETVLDGFSRFWRHWGLVIAVMTYIEAFWPGWASSAATLFGYLFDLEHRTLITMGILIVAGLILTLSPVIYLALERLAYVKVALIAVFAGISLTFAISPAAWRALPRNVTAPTWPTDLGMAIILSAIIFAGTGGGANLAQSNWIRDKRYGMGKYVPRLVSPLTGKKEGEVARTGFRFEPTKENLGRWHRWWRLANGEQLVTFVLISTLFICLTSMLAFSVVYGATGLEGGLSFLKLEGARLKASVGPWFRILFLSIGVFSLFFTVMGVLDFTSRLAADVLKTSYLRRFKENWLYVTLVWGMIAMGCVITLSGLSEPLQLLEITATVAALNMSIYSTLLIVLNRRILSREIWPRAYRVAALLWAVCLFSGLAAASLWQHAERMLHD